MGGHAIRRSGPGGCCISQDRTKEMSSLPIVRRATLEEWTDEDVVQQVLAGETGAFEIIMRRYNQRLYRVALGIVGDASEAQDVMQEAYVRAFEHISQF